MPREKYLGYRGLSRDDSGCVICKNGRAVVRKDEYRKIHRLDLSKFERPTIPNNRGTLVRIIWYLTNELLFRNPICGLTPSKLKASVLRLFGAKIGKRCVIKPRVSIKYPWFLKLGDYSWLGEGVWIDNHCSVTIGSNCCISQGAYLFTGNHRWDIETFDFFSKPVHINDGSWVAAFAIVPPGTTVPESSFYSDR